MSVHTSPTTGRGRRRKAVLVCPDCGHESAPTGDWVVHERAGEVVYECPVCETTIATRGRRELSRHS